MESMVHDQGEMRVDLEMLWAPSCLLDQDTSRMNQYLSGFRPRNVERTGQVVSRASTLRPRPVMGLKTLGMIIVNLRCKNRIKYVKQAISDPAESSEFTAKILCVYSSDI